MSKVVIVTDTTACVPQEMVTKYGIEVVPVDFIFGDEVYRDGIDMSPTEFYARFRKAKKLPTTSGSLPEPFLEAYRRASARASSILCITLPSKLSAMFNSARLAIDMAKEALPDAVIELVDCSTAAAGQGLVVIEAARAAASGKDLAEVKAVVQKVMQQVNLFATLDTLRYLVKVGRVPKAVGLAGSILQIKPIFTVNSGEAFPVAKARTMAGAIKRILKMMDEKVVRGKPLHVAIMHADAIDRAMALSKEVSSRFDYTELLIMEFTPVMGVHTGPGVIGVAFYNED